MWYNDFAFHVGNHVGRRELERLCKDRLEVGSFSLRKFTSNSAELEKMVNKNYGMLTEEHNCLLENKILGLKWDKFEDSFAFDFTEIREKFDVLLTKCHVVKAIASVYDPLGLLNPVVVQMKIFFQSYAQ